MVNSQPKDGQKDMHLLKSFRVNTASLIFIVVIFAISVSMVSAAEMASISIKTGLDQVVLAHDGNMLRVSLDPPSLKFKNAVVKSNAKLSETHGNLAAGETLEARFTPAVLDDSSKVEMLLMLKWYPKEGVLRKWVRMRLIGTDSPKLLEEIVLEDIDIGNKQVALQSDGIQSYPAYMDGFFVGIEFPIASTRITDKHLILAHQPGIKLQPGVWYESRKAVYGVAARGMEKQAFERYISMHRPTPYKLHVNYNSWWTSPAPYYTEADILDLMQKFGRDLYRPYKVSFDTFCIDMGWSNPKSIWEIDEKLFPDGFSNIERGASNIGSHLGLWVSPSSQYPTALDNNWAESKGFETFMTPWDWRYTCLAGTKYRETFRSRLLDLIERYKIRHLKFDGYQFICYSPDHGHEPGILSAEACAEGIIEIFESIHESAPDAWIESTCFGFNPSPWWACYSNSVIGTFGDDAPTGRVPCPIYRESYTTARDYFNLQGAEWLSVPIAAQEVLGIIHQSSEPFTNDAVITIMRGHMFLPLYINPKFMDKSRWKTLAGIIKWARKNEAMLAETEPILPVSWQNGKCPKITRDAPMPREPYGYAHWTKNKGVVALRNPWIAPTICMVKLKTLPQNKPLYAVSIYPEVRLYGSNLKGGSVLKVPLAPYETLVLEISSSKPPKGLPKASNYMGYGVKAISSKSKTARVVFKSNEVGIDGSKEFGADWTSEVGASESAVEMEGIAEVVVPKTGGELLLLREGNDPRLTPLHKVIIDGKEIKTRSVSCSADGWAAGVTSPEQWIFLRYPLAQGKHSIQFKMIGRGDNDRLSAWVWNKRAASPAYSNYPNAMPQPEMVYVSASCLADTGRTALKTIEAPKPVKKINGVYLDALEPKSARMDYGTLQKNKNITGAPIVIGRNRYARGIGSHSNAIITYEINGKYKRLQAWVGTDAGSRGSVTFEVRIDGRKAWESGLMRGGDNAKRVDLDITGAKTIELVVGDGGDGINSDWADWADAMLLR